MAELSQESPLLFWTGHPLADVGVATACAMVNKAAPEDVTLDDLDFVANELRQAYLDPFLVAYLSCVYTMNAPYTNPSMSDDVRRTEVDRVLLAHRVSPDAEAQGLMCVFSRRPATHVVHRAQIPMLTGGGVLNFFPAGRSELPVAGPFLVAIQSLAFGGRRSEGKLLIVHCDDPRWTLEFARQYVADNRRVMDLARAGRLPDQDGPNLALERECAAWDGTKKRPKYPDVKAPHSFVMDDLLQVANRRATGRMKTEHTSVTVYHLSNSGQGPSLVVDHVPSQFVSFIQQASRVPYQPSWKALIGQGWRMAREEQLVAQASTEVKGKRKPKKPGKPAIPGGPGRSRNDVYNDLLRIYEAGFCDPAAAAQFVRRHLLRFSRPRDNGEFRLRRGQLDLIHWDLTGLFLEKVMGMDKQRIERIRQFADRLAEVICKTRDKSLFRDLVYQHKAWEYRNALSKAQRNLAKDRRDLLFGLDDYVQVFLADDAVGAADWGLVRDLISIRLVESLHQQNFFGGDMQELLDEETEPATVAAEE